MRTTTSKNVASHLHQAPTARPRTWHVREKARSAPYKHSTETRCNLALWELRSQNRLTKAICDRRRWNGSTIGYGIGYQIGGRRAAASAAAASHRATASARNHAKKATARNHAIAAAEYVHSCRKPQTP